MPSTTSSQSGYPYSLLPLTTNLDAAEIYNLENISPELRQILVKLYQNLNTIAIQTNSKTTGIFLDEIIVPNISYFSDSTTSSTDTSISQSVNYRGVLRKVVNFGSLPNATTKSVPHGLDLTPDSILVHMYGAATFPNTAWIPLPYANPTLNLTVSLNMDATNVNITTGVDRTAFTICYVVIEYIP